MWRYAFPEPTCLFGASDFVFTHILAADDSGAHGTLCAYGCSWATDGAHAVWRGLGAYRRRLYFCRYGSGAFHYRYTADIGGRTLLCMRTTNGRQDLARGDVCDTLDEPLRAVEYDRGFLAWSFGQLIKIGRACGAAFGIRLLGLRWPNGVHGGGGSGDRQKGAVGSLGGGAREMNAVNEKKVRRGIELGMVGCHVCGKVSDVREKYCPRCGSCLHIRKPDSIARTMALLVAAVIMYLPANLLPILTTRELGISTESTIIVGMMDFWNKGSYPIAIVIFMASIVIPTIKIVALLWLCAAAKGLVPHSARRLGKIYWITELLGRWSMVDIFVVAILVTMVQLGNYIIVTPGSGALAFAGVVILTMFAAMSFDPRLVWDQLEREEVLSSAEPLSEYE